MPEPGEGTQVMAEPKGRHITSKATPPPPAPPSSAATLVQPVPHSSRVATDRGLGVVEYPTDDTIHDDPVSAEMLPSDFLNTDPGSWSDHGSSAGELRDVAQSSHRHETDRAFPAPPSGHPSALASSPESDPPTAIKPNEPPATVPPQPDDSDDELINTLVNSPGPDDEYGSKPLIDPTAPTMQARLEDLPQSQPAAPPVFAPPIPAAAGAWTQNAASGAAMPQPSAPVFNPLPQPSAPVLNPLPPASPTAEASGYTPHLQVPAAGPSIKMVMAAGAGVGVLGAIALVAYFGARGSEDSSPDPAEGATASAEASPEASEAAAETLAAEPDASADSKPPPSEDTPPTTTGAETKARAALEKIRAGLDHCVKNVVHVLPGPTPAVPRLFATLKGGPYPSNWKDWDNPAWHCTGVKLKEPQPFQIQWQVDVPSREGVGVAWFDENGNGEADVELYFEAKLLERDVVDVGDIQRREITRQPIRVR